VQTRYWTRQINYDRKLWTIVNRAYGSRVAAWAKVLQVIYPYHEAGNFVAFQCRLPVVLRGASRASGLESHSTTCQFARSDREDVQSGTPV
jgi:hypothetical protein